MMDKMGHKEGEVLQHSMITKSIERAQKKVEENNFGIRKRLLEYDDVMNAQRDVIYKRRRHALFGDRLSIDLDNALFDVCDNLATLHEGSTDLENFKVEVMKHLTIEPEITMAELKDAAAVREKLYQQAKDFYQRKMDNLRANVLPQFQRIKEMQGDKVENVVIPFTDGMKGIQIYVSMKESLERECRPVVETLERNITLALIDDQWKDHLRAMDDLRHSVQMASYEQKDPLLIYKFEAFELFRKMLLEINQHIISFLFRAGIPIQEAPPQPAARMPLPQTDMSSYRDNKAEIDAAGQDYAADENDYYEEPTMPNNPPVKRQPTVNVEPKIGRNDPCPCGSGKKYKNCHGK